MSFRVAFTIPLASPVPSLANMRQHWRSKAKLVASQRRVMGHALHQHAAPFLVHARKLLENPALGLHVALVRVAKRQLDDDNLAHAFKAMRDELAACVGLDDRSSRYTWQYLQRQGDPAVVVSMEVVRVDGTSEQPRLPSVPVVQDVAAPAPTRGRGLLRPGVVLTGSAPDFHVSQPLELGVADVIADMLLERGEPLELVDTLNAALTYGAVVITSRRIDRWLAERHINPVAADVAIMRELFRRLEDPPA